MNKIIIKTIKELETWRLTIKNDLHFVPTMGNLHEGHKKLIQTAAISPKKNTIVSIFINPLQFNNEEDLSSYPKTIANDINMAFLSGANAIFIPKTEEIFPKDNNNINFLKASKELSSNLCGLKREGHFDGVCTVVFRLLNLIKPQKIFLGEKDWQQLLIIKKMIDEKKIDIQIQSIATERDYDGIPFSSRNNLLSIDERESIRSFSKELSNAKKLFNKKKNFVLKDLIKKLERKNISIEYLEHVNALNLRKTITEDNITMLAGAIICGNKRLIDHVFLMKRNPIIAIDGPAGSGKSTVTKLVAKKLNLLYLDTGAMYRALSWYLVNENINYENNRLDQILKNISIVFKSNMNSNQDVFINDFCVTKEIRSQKISSIVSSISSIKEIREFLVEEQRKIGNLGGLVAEGRDIGTKVFPQAEVKIYLTASINERAKRRKLELENNGNKKIDFEELKTQIKNRDFKDSNREISPLKKAEDAIEIITDGYLIDEVVEKITSIYKETIPKELQK